MSLPTPNTRKEQYLNAIATGNAGGLPTPITREEEYLNAIAKSGGGSGDGDMKKSVYDSDLAVANAGGIGAFVGDAVSGKVDKVEGKGLSTNDYSDTEKGKVASNTTAIATNATAIEVIENVLGAKNIFHGWLVESSTRLNTTFDITPATSYIFTYDEPVKQLQYRLYFNSSGTDTEITSGWTNLSSPLSFTTFNDTSYVGLRIRYADDSAILPTDITSSMIRPAGTDATYVPYAMTNRELTERFAVITGNTASDTNVTTFSYPQGFTQDNTFIVTLAIYINSYWYQYNNTTTFYAATANGSVNVVAEDAGARNKPIKLLLMKV